MGLQMQKQGIVMLTRIIALVFVLSAPIAASAQTETVYYVHTDAIGSVRSITNQDQEEVARHDFLPFGEEWTATSFANITSTVRFAGLERDPETGLDYAMARYYRPQSGRFTQPDVPGVDQSLLDSQSWNTYTYVRNQPVRYIDTTGLKCENSYDLEKGVFCAEIIAEEPYRRTNEAWIMSQQFYWDRFFDSLLTPQVVNFSAGLGDALLLGTGPFIRSQLDIDVVNRCSSAYDAGGWSSFALGASRIGYAGLAKAGSMFASSGAQASAFRQALKTAARLGFASSWRQPNLARYATDEALRAAAGRTNPAMNALAVGVAAAGSAGAQSCGQ
jgi:RHS repeat-associated protein